MAFQRTLLRRTILLMLVLAAPFPGLGQDGHLRLGGRPGEVGVWVPPNAGDERLVEPDDIVPAAPNAFTIEANPLQRIPRVDSPNPSTDLLKKLKVGEVPFQPWARALYAYRQQHQLEPHTRCKPSGGPRPFLTPYGVEFLDMKDQQRVLIVDIGGPHSIRPVYTDGRPHPKDLTPSYLGHSIGRWEKDTLVVDTVGFNERFWIDRFGLPHTEQLHIIERFTRVGVGVLKYEVTIDDPGAYTLPWTSGLLLRWSPNQELFEYICQENNLAPNLMFTGESLSDESIIVP